MLKELRVPIIWRVSVRIHSQTGERLADSCFKGVEKRLAGNFFKWRDVQALFADECFFDQFLVSVEKRIQRNEFGPLRETISYPQNVGWESTADLVAFQKNDLEVYYLKNRRASALRVKLERKKLAPKTSDVTVAFELRQTEDCLELEVLTIYPGFDIGPLVGDITKKTDRVFFGWDNPGRE